MVTNMIVELDAMSFDTHEDEARLEQEGVSLTNEQGTDQAAHAWIARHFTPTWANEAAHASNWFARKAGELAGFASYEQRHYRWWWLRNWRKQPDVGIFGPVGVLPALRGNHLGCVLTRKALASIRALGFRRAVIPRVGPVAFYERCCGARIGDTVRLFGIF